MLRIMAELVTLLVLLLTGLHVFMIYLQLQLRFCNRLDCLDWQALISHVSPALQCQLKYIYAKIHENKTLAKGRNHSAVY